MRRVVDMNELRAEAIKLIKDRIKRGWSWKEDEDWWKFFNITEEDLKDD